MKYSKVDFWHIPTSDISKAIRKESSSALSMDISLASFFPHNITVGLHLVLPSSYTTFSDSVGST